MDDVKTARKGYIMEEKIRMVYYADDTILIVELINDLR